MSQEFQTALSQEFQTALSQRFQTADLCDDHDSEVEVIDLPFQSFGSHRRFFGPAVTLKLFEDNSLVKETLSQPGHGRVLVVDGSGSRRCALVGDRLAQKGVDNGWAGIVVYGMIRDSAPIAPMAIGIKALGTCPRKSIKRGVGLVDETLKFGGVVISPDSFIYSDEDGVLVAARELLGAG